MKSSRNGTRCQTVRLVGELVVQCRWYDHYEVTQNQFLKSFNYNYECNRAEVFQAVAEDLSTNVFCLQAWEDSSLSQEQVAEMKQWPVPAVQHMP